MALPTDNEIDAAIPMSGRPSRALTNKLLKDIRSAMSQMNDSLPTLQQMKGETGEQGEQGPKGERGEQGSQGVRGEQGNHGSDGAAGPLGPQGIQGETGPMGPQGPQGTPGQQGIRGIEGPQGITGATGSMGLQGEIGPKGEQGIQGVAGPKGEIGPAGATGPQGAPGVVSAPPATPRTYAIGSVYRASDPTRPAFITVNLQSQSTISLTGSSNNEGVIVVGDTTAVGAGTGRSVGYYANRLGGGLVVGLNLSVFQANSFMFLLPAGYYFCIRQTVGTGLQVASSFEQLL